MTPVTLLPEFWWALAWGAAIGAVVARHRDVVDLGLRGLDRLERWLDDAGEADAWATGRPAPPRLPRSHVRPVSKERQP